MAILYELATSQNKSTTAFHPQTDGQTERVNQSVEQYLRLYCRYQQDDWEQLLPLAQFTYNNIELSATKMSPFFAIYGRHPRFFEVPKPTNNSSINGTADLISQRMLQLNEVLRVDMQDAQNKMAQAYNRNVKQAPEFKEGELVMLDARNITTSRPSKKLDRKYLGPYHVDKQVGSSAYRLKLSKEFQFHPTFHVSLLHHYHANTIQDRRQPAPPPVIVGENIELEVEAIVASRWHYNKLQYLVKWRDSNLPSQWLPHDNVKNAPLMIDAYHSRHPFSPKPGDMPRKSSAGRRGKTRMKCTH